MPNDFFNSIKDFFLKFFNFFVFLFCFILGFIMISNEVLSFSEELFLGICFSFFFVFLFCLLNEVLNEFFSSFTVGLKKRFSNVFEIASYELYLSFYFLKKNIFC